MGEPANEEREVQGGLEPTGEWLEAHRRLNSRLVEFAIPSATKMVTLHPTKVRVDEAVAWNRDLATEPGLHYQYRGAEDPDLLNLYIYEVADGSPSSYDRRPERATAQYCSAARWPPSIRSATVDSSSGSVSDGLSMSSKPSASR